MKTLATVMFVIAAGPLLAGQNGRPGRAAPPAVDAAVSPAEVQRMFDAYALMQAQDQLQISEGQFSTFLTRYKALQDVRRRTLQGRARVVNELRRLLNQGQPDDAQIKDLLKRLQDVEAQGAAD